MNESKKSICYICKHWEWEWSVDLFSTGSLRADICMSSVKNLSGDNVFECIGFERAKKYVHEWPKLDKKD